MAHKLLGDALAASGSKRQPICHEEHALAETAIRQDFSPFYNMLARKSKTSHRRIGSRLLELTERCHALSNTFIRYGMIS